MNKSAVESVKLRSAELPKDLVQQKLSFNKEQIVKTMIHSSFISSKYLMESIL